MIKLSKRVLCCLLTLILCSGAVVGNAEVTADNKTEATKEVVTVSSEIQEMMSLLRLFEIIPEYYDYNVPITSDVTRADFVAAVARLMGKKIYGGTNVYFYDVPKTHWAYNEISNLAELGFINGSGNKMFNPDVAIAKGEAYKILLSAMGYGAYAEYNGGFPAGYIDVANRIDITKGVSNSDKLTMSDMFYLIYNAMKTNVFEATVSGGGVVYEEKEGESILSIYQDVYYGEGVVGGAKSVTVDNGALNEDDVLIDDEIYKTGDVAMFDYIGQEVEFFYHEDKLENKTILWARSVDDTETLSINVDNDASFDEKTFDYTYYDEKGKKRTINLDRGITLIYNGGIVESGYGDILNGDRYSIKLVESKGEYIVAIVKEYKNYVAGSMSTSDFKVYDKIVPQKNVVLDEELYDTFSITMAGIGSIDFEDIKQGSVLSVFESKDKKHMEVIVSNNMAVGTIREISEDDGWYNVFINETEYQMDKAIYTENLATGDSVKAYLDFNGNIAYMEISDSEFEGAFLIELYPKDDLDDEINIKHLAQDGKVIVSGCADKVVIDGRRFKDVAEIKKTLIAGESDFIPQFALVKKNSDGEITEIDTITYNPKYETTSSLSVDVPFKNEADTEMKQKHIRSTAAATRIGEKILFDQNTVVFSIPMTDDYKKANENEFTVLPPTGLVNDTGVYAQSYKTAEEGSISKYILVQGYDSKSTTFEFPVIVDRIGKGVDEEGSVVEVLHGYQGASSVSINADSGTSDVFSKSGIKPGMLVKLGKNNSGNVDECTVLYDYRNPGEYKNSALNDVFGVFNGYVNNVIGDVLKVGFNSGDAFDYAIKVETLPVLIYDTSSTRNPIYTANIGDAVTYKNDPELCSRVVVITSRMQGRMVLIYK